MNTDSMRKIDRWAGEPLCFILRVLDLLTKPLSLLKRPRPPVNFLFIKPSEMGAIILSYSLIEKIKEKYPGCNIYFLTFRTNRPLLDALKVLPPENILVIDDKSLAGFAIDTLVCLVKMGRLRIDVVFDLELFSRFTAILAYLSGADKRIGYYGYHLEGLYRGNLLTHKIQYNPLLHTAKSILSLGEVLDFDTKPSPELPRRIDDSEIKIPQYFPLESRLSGLREKLAGLGIENGRRILLVNPGDGILPLREWPQENFIALCRMLLSDEANRIVIIGTEGATKKSAEIAAALGRSKCLDLTGKTTVEDVLCLFNLASALIVNDCGLAHMASLTNIKKFVIFGPESPQVFAPLRGDTRVIFAEFPCSPCLSAFNHRNSACRDNLCLKAITPEYVYQLVTKNL
ncbi:MAG: glycosyltransferase family 9 protein [Candidatus Omnitrophica bacterium]|nr:glycosyltransferase family 9 protein [Candidatus Omnitrophota bacterium]MBU1869752.1 glycosyltransferase family 9 protein [Candidatus Omnitrophota bacterium]